jgi:hypothetical protein
MSFLRSFGAFWYDFLIGDRPELFVGPVVLLAVTWGLIQAGVDATVVGGILVLGALTIGFGGVWLAVRLKT